MMSGKNNMKTYNIVFELVNVKDDDLENISNVLYGNGCDDAIVFMRNGSTYIEFDRKAININSALKSAKKNIINSGICEHIIRCIGITHCI